MITQNLTTQNRSEKKKTRHRGRNDGSIFKERNGNFRAMVTLPNGKRRSKTFQTKEACKDWIREMMTAPPTEENLPGETTNWTVRAWFDEWLAQSKNLVRPGTYYDYERFSTRIILPALGDVPLKDLTRRQVNGFYHDLTEKQKLGISSVRLVHRILHRALEMALQVNLITMNPAHGANVPRKEEVEMKVLNEPQIWTFLTTVRGHEREVLYDLAIKTGMREGELLGLKWSDLDLYHGTLTIQRQAKRVSGSGIQLRPLKTKSSRRSLNLGENTLALLRVHKVNQDVMRLEQGDKWQDNDLIFPSMFGTPMDQSNLVAEFKGILAVAGLPEIRFHDLRHTAASVMLKHLKDIMVVSRTLGHSRPTTTLNVYSHLLPGMQAEAAQRIDEALSPTAINGGMQVGIGAAVQAEIDTGMNLGWRRKRGQLKGEGQK